MGAVHRLAELSLRHPRATLCLVLAATLLAGLGATRITSEAGYRAFLGAEHPAVLELDAFAQRFGGGLPFAAVWSCGESPACESVFDPASLAMAHAVARGMEGAPGVRRVDGPATSPLLVPVLFELPEVRRLAPEGIPAEDLETLAERAVTAASWSGQIVSADGRAGALLVHLESSDAALGARALATLRGLLAPFEARGFQFHLVGGPVEFVVAGDELARNAARIVPLMLALVALLLVALFRTPAAAVVSLASVGLAVVFTLGLQGWLGWPANSLTQVLPPLVLVLGVCDTIHLLAGYASRSARREQASPAEREAALLQVAREVGGACLMTSLTTAAGFASFAVSGLEGFVRFGWLAAAGVLAALVLCFTLLPVATVALPPRWLASPRAGDAWDAALARVVSLAQRRARGVLVAAAAVAALGSLGFAGLRVDARFEDLYGEDSQVVRWARAAAAHLREPETLELALHAPDGPELHDPQALAVLARVEALASLEGLGPALSLLVPMRELNELVHHGPLVLDASDASRERARHMLRILRFEDAELVEFLLDEEGRSYRVSLQSAKLPQAELRRLLAEVDRRLAAALPDGWSATVTGPLAVVSRMIDEIRSTQLRSFALAGVLVWGLVAVYFRSPGLACLALVPTALPVLATLGAMGLLGVALDVGSAMVAAVLLGLGVDDAIHLLSAWRRRRRAGDGPAAAMAGAMQEVGRALATTSFALAVGFGALALAPWHSIASFGRLSAVAILLALACVLLVLPALVVSLAGRSRRSGGPAGSA
jgi:predicted RND superfamily exporter protein